MECFKCGVSDKKTLLFNAISSNGIVQICRRCSFRENIPIIKKPSGRNFSNTAKVPSEKDRPSQEKEDLLKKENESLKSLIEKRTIDHIQQSKKMENLVNNFHWVIMRARRAKKLTQEQFAVQINEPVSLIKFAEKGIIPEGKDDFVRKLENYLQIIIVKREDYERTFNTGREGARANFLKRAEDGNLAVDSATSKILTLSDLKELQQNRGALLKNKPQPVEESQESDSDEEDSDKDKKDQNRGILSRIFSRKKS